MKRTFWIFSLVLFVFLNVMFTTIVAADDIRQQKSPYVIIEGKVTSVSARLLIIDGQQYPITMFVRVFFGDEQGAEITMQTIANSGKIDLARLYILGGKVEKIIVLKNI